MSAPPEIRLIGDAGWHSWRRGTVAGQAVVVDAYLRPWTPERLARVQALVAGHIRCHEAAAVAGNPTALGALPALWARAAALDQAAALLTQGPPAHQPTVEGRPEETTLRCVCGAIVRFRAPLWSGVWQTAVRAFLAVHPVPTAPSEDDRR